MWVEFQSVLACIIDDNHKPRNNILVSLPPQKIGWQYYLHIVRPYFYTHIKNRDIAFTKRSDFQCRRYINPYTEISQNIQVKYGGQNQVREIKVMLVLTILNRIHSLN